MKKIRPTQKVVMMTDVEVYYYNIIVGRGLSFYDGENLHTDIVSLTGEILPMTWYDIKFVSEPVLAIHSLTVQ